MPYVYCEYNQNKKPIVISVYLGKDCTAEIHPGPDAVNPDPNDKNSQDKIGKWLYIENDVFAPSRGSSHMNVITWLNSDTGKTLLKDTFSFQPTQLVVRANVRNAFKQRLNISVQRQQRTLGPTIERGIDITSDPRLLDLRKGIVGFTKNLFSEMHKYCDPITMDDKQGNNRGALYGDYTGNRGKTDAWESMMSFGIMASYIAAYLKEEDEIAKSWDALRGNVPSEYSTCNDMGKEGKKCIEALQRIGLCCSVLLTALSDDDQNELRKNENDSNRRSDFRRWAIDSLARLYALTQTAHEPFIHSGNDNAGNILLEQLPPAVITDVKSRAEKIIEEQQLSAGLQNLSVK